MLSSSKASFWKAILGVLLIEDPQIWSD